MTALVGKLPAHGDFIRRGGPPPLVRLVEDWLDGELAGAAARDPAAFEESRDVGEWRFSAELGGAPVLGALIGSHDAVGRSFPLLGLLSGAVADFEQADRWCGAAADVLHRARQGAIRADEAHAMLQALQPPAGGAAPSLGWWRPGDAAADGAAGLPTDVAFDRLLARDAA